MSDRMILGRSELDGSDLDLSGEQDPTIYAINRMECIYSAKIKELNERIHNMDAESESDQDCISRQAKDNEAKQARINELFAECAAHTAKEAQMEARYKALIKRLNKTVEEYESIIERLKSHKEEK